MSYIMKIHGIFWYWTQKTRKTIPKCAKMHVVSAAISFNLDHNFVNRRLLKLLCSRAYVNIHFIQVTWKNLYMGFCQMLEFNIDIVVDSINTVWY